MQRTMDYGPRTTYVSDQAEKLRALVTAAEPVVECAEGAPAMVVVSGGRAGVGATTVSLNLAAVLADRGERVLVVDAAEQRNAMRDVAGLRREVPHGLQEVVEGKCDIGEAIVAGPAGVAMVVSHGHVAPIEDSPWRRRGLEPRRDTATWAGSRHASQMLVSSLQSLADEFDVVVVDAGSGMSAWVQRLWSRARLVALVTTPDNAAVLDAYATFKRGSADAPQLPVRLVVNQAESDSIASETQRRIEASCQRFLSRALPALPALPRHLASEFIDSPAPPRVWEMPNTPFGHAALWLGRAVSEMLRIEDAGCGMQGVAGSLSPASGIPHPASC